MVAKSMVPTVNHGGGGVGCFVCDTVGELFKTHPAWLPQHQHAIPSSLPWVRTTFAFQQDNDPKHLPPLFDHLRWLLTEAQEENPKGVQSIYWSKGRLFWRIYNYKTGFKLLNTFCRGEQKLKFLAKPKSQDIKRNYCAIQCFPQDWNPFVVVDCREEGGRSHLAQNVCLLVTLIAARVNMYADIVLPATLILSYINIEKDMTQ